MDEYAVLGRFGHREHLHLAWSCLRRKSLPATREDVAGFIRHVVRRHGAPDKYHETLTRFWIHATALALAGSARPDDFDALLAEHPHLGDKGLPYRHWTRALLDSEVARREWVEPDLLPLPPLPA
jgi:hypothetical protein